MTVQSINYSTSPTLDGMHAPGQISATVRVKDKETEVISPKVARVDVYDERTGRLAAQTWSRASDGAYRAEGLIAGRRYKVTASDNGRIYRLVGADNLIAEAP